MFVDLQLAASPSGRPSYKPGYGRFVQPDPIGYEGGTNLYAYVGNDPINLTDSLGLDDDPKDPPFPKKPPLICTGTRITSGCGSGGIAGWASGFSTAGTGGQYSISNPPPGGYYRCTNCGQTATQDGRDIVVQAPQYQWVSVGSSSPPAGFPVRFNYNRSSVAPSPTRKADYCGSQGSEWVPDGIWGSACAAHDVCYASPGSSKVGCDLGLIIDIKSECAKAGISCLGMGTIYGFGLIGAGFPGGPSRDAYNRAQGN